VRIIFIGDKKQIKEWWRVIENKWNLGNTVREISLHSMSSYDLQQY
jgi:hypothetical protein